MTTRKTRRRPPNTLGTIRQNRSGRYSASYRVGDQTYRAPRTFADRAGAEAWLGRERADLHLGIWRDPDRGRDTLAAYATDWITSRRDLAPRTRDLYENLARRWLFAPITNGDLTVELGAYPLASLTPALLRRWFAIVSDMARTGALSRLRRAGSRRPHPARAWAVAQGHAMASTGRLSPKVMTAWTAAGCPSAVPDDAVPAEMRHAGRTQAAQAFRLLRAILNAAVADGLIDANPATTLRGAGTVHHRERGTASPAEVAALADAVPGRFRAAVLLAAWSGLRFGEVVALARRHVDLAAGTVRVERSLVARAGVPVTFGDPKTPKSRRVVHLPASVVEELRQHLARYVPLGPEQLIFTTETGAPATGAHVSRMFRRARTSIGRDDLTFHDLRHTAALAAYTVGATQRAAQDRLGHSTARAAAIYAHVAENADAALAVRLDDLARSAGGSA